LREKNCPVPAKKDTETVFDYYIDPVTCDWRLCKPEEWVPPATKGAVNFS
jgi:hypothetical protein